MRTLLLLVAHVDIQCWGWPLVQKMEKSICCFQELLHHYHLASFALPICLLSESNTSMRRVAGWAKAGWSWVIRDHHWCREKAPCGLFSEEKEKSSAWSSMCAYHLSAGTGHGRLHGRNTSSTQIIVMQQCKQEQGLVTYSCLIPFCFYRCAVHGNEMISSSKHLSRGETNQLFTNASKWQDLSDMGCGESLSLILDLL